MLAFAVLIKAHSECMRRPGSSTAIPRGSLHDARTLPLPAWGECRLTERESAHRSRYSININKIKMTGASVHKSIY
jgi:hypothetical protein